MNQLQRSALIVLVGALVAMAIASFAPSHSASCAPGYEQACDARDHGAHPYSGHGH
jgi:hypothetical protein